MVLYFWAGKSLGSIVSILIFFNDKIWLSNSNPTYHIGYVSIQFPVNYNLKFLLNIIFSESGKADSLLLLTLKCVNFASKSK